MRASVALLVLIGAAGVLAADDKDKEKAVKKDLKAFAGKWKAVSVESDGKKITEDELKDIYVTHDGNKITVRKGDTPMVEGTIEIDPTKKPKTVDFTSTQEKTKGQVSRGIYEFDGDSYRLCLAAPGKDRPKEFSGKEGSGHALIVYKREKKK
jgi:uncharacterized protein (TIGR03067 family)